MQQLVNQLGTDQDSPQLQAQLHKVQQYTNGLAKDTTAELRTFKSIIPPSGEEGRGWRVQQDRLYDKFMQVRGLLYWFVMLLVLQVLDCCN